MICIICDTAKNCGPYDPEKKKLLHMLSHRLSLSFVVRSIVAREISKRSNNEVWYGTESCSLCEAEYLIVSVRMTKICSDNDDQMAMLWNSKQSAAKIVEGTATQHVFGVLTLLDMSPAIKE